MNPESMLSELNEREKNLRGELIELERQFNAKKEQYLKIQGAIEVLTLVEEVNPED